jgi:YggT family protein
VQVFIYVYSILILAYIITSWVRLPYSPWLRRIQDFLRDVCEPYLRLFRRVIPAFGPLDISPIVAILSLFLLMKVVDAIFSRV